MNDASNISARYLALLVDHLEAQGIDCTPALSLARIARPQLQHAQARLSLAQVVSAMRGLSDVSQRGDLGFVIGGLISPGLFGDLGRALLATATLGDGIDCLCSYFVLAAPDWAMHSRPQGRMHSLTWQPLLALPYDLLVSTFDTILVTFHTQVALLVPQGLPAYDAYLTVPEPKHIERYRELKPVRCHFNQSGLPSLRIDIDADVMRTPMPFSNTAELAQAEDLLRARLSLHRHRTIDWQNWVTMMLHEARDCQPTQAQLAQLMNVSESTLARHLAEQGCSFRALSNEVRHKLACQWLTESSLSITDVAHRLGYSEMANFSRAFRQRAGLSPREYVRAQKQA